MKPLKTVLLALPLLAAAISGSQSANASIVGDTFNVEALFPNTGTSLGSTMITATTGSTFPLSITGYNGAPFGLRFSSTGSVDTLLIDFYYTFFLTGAFNGLDFMVTSGSNFGNLTSATSTFGLDASNVTDNGSSLLINFQGYNTTTTDTVTLTFESGASTVPLPASAPMFGAAILALGAVGYGMKRKGSVSA